MSTFFILHKNIVIKNILQFTILLFSTFAVCQDIDQYKEYQNKVRYYYNINLERVFSYSKKLLKSNDPCIISKAKNNIASAYYKSGNFKKSEEIALTILSDTSIENCNLKIKYRSLTRLFWIKNNQRKFDEAFNYLEKQTQFLSKYPDNEDNVRWKKIFIRKKLALLKSNLGFHQEAITLSKQVLEEFSKIKPDNKNLHNYTLKIAIASSFNTLGDTYFDMSDNNDKYLDSSLIYYKKAFLVTEEFNPKHKNSLSLYNLREANVLIKRKEFKKALEKVNSYELDHKSQNYHFLKSIIFKNLKINDSSYYHSYKLLNFKNTSPSSEKNKIAIFNILADLYNSSNKIDSAFKYSKLALDKLKSLNKSKTEANKNHYIYDFDQIKKVNDSIINKEIKTKVNLIITFLIITILIITIGLYLLKKEKKRSSENLTTSKKDYSINLELEEMVLRELENFEISEIYLDSTFNINKLAKQLNTNTSYLSSIVNEKKEKTYKQYIAELIMNYLLNLINKEPKYRKYTIEALGNKIGYTNASSFSRSFKNFNGLSPSEYLNSLNNGVT